MASSSKRVHKHFQLDVQKIRRTQKVFKAKTETEAIERALDFAIEEHEKNRLVAEANERFVGSGAEIKDAYGKLAD
jgi:acetylornithine/succinyldiaminopimelate/putrescine aminotransferase